MLVLTSKYLLNAGSDDGICVESNPCTECLTHTFESLSRTEIDLKCCH